MRAVVNVFPGERFLLESKMRNCLKCGYLSPLLSDPVTEIEKLTRQSALHKVEQIALINRFYSYEFLLAHSVKALQ